MDLAEILQELARSTFAGSTLPDPIRAETLAIPGDDGLRLDIRREQAISPTIRSRNSKRVSSDAFGLRVARLSDKCPER